jgi:hypothetical protein
MKIDAEKSRYGEEYGWSSDPESFARVAAMWRHWIGAAEEQLYTAQVLLPHFQQRDAAINRFMQEKEPVHIPPCVGDGYFLHCALAVENALKGVIVATRADEIRANMRAANRKVQETRLPEFILTHDLVQLAAKAGYAVTTTDDEYTLTYLSRYGTWAGRFPFPVRSADNALTNKLSNGSHYMMGAYYPDKVPAFLAFANTVYSWAHETAKRVSD